MEKKARIICFDVKGVAYPIVALVEEDGHESTIYYNEKGRTGSYSCDYDLMMLSEKKEMWINIYKGTICLISGGGLYDTEEEAKDAVKGDENYVTTVKVCWEE